MNRSVRLACYVQHMFPPLALVPIGVMQFLALYFGLQALAGSVPLRAGVPAAVAATSTVLWMLLVRLEDDITDADLDIRLGRAGDPRYKDRPIVKGEITVPELRLLYWSVTGTIVGLNILFGMSMMLFACVLGLAITWLGFRWFFIPALMRDPSPLQYLFRKALTLLLGFYALATFARDFGWNVVTGWTVPLLFAPVAGVVAWETSRKIRVPEDETEYGTYSKVLGWKVAALLPATSIGLCTACMVLVARAAGLSLGYFALLLASAAVAVGACLRFRIWPSRAHANLRPYAELFGATSHGGLALALVLHYGVVFA